LILSLKVEGEQESKVEEETRAAAMTKEQSRMDAIKDNLWKADFYSLDEVELREFIRALEAIMENVGRRIDTLRAKSAVSDDHKKN
jgi:hypothetical protein